MTGELTAKLLAFDPDLPLEQAHTIPSPWYRDADIAAAERCLVFGNTWQAVGRADQVAEPGAYFTAEIAGEPLLVVRDGEGVLRAFYNVCRHRAARVTEAAEGRTTRFRCRYHGWTYDLAGQLRGTPEFEGVADFRRKEQGLVALAVATWGPFVWVHPAPSQSLEGYLAPLPERVQGLEALRFVGRREYRLACNWKVFIDNYLDGGYHVNTVHPGLAAVLDYAQYRTEIAGNTSVQLSPLRPADAAHAEVGNVRCGDVAQYWWIFPNFMLNLYEGILDTNLVLPEGPDHCRVVFDFYFARTTEDGAAQRIAESMRVADLIQQEDIGICEEVQRGLGSRSYQAGRFSVRREAAGYHFHRLLARHLRPA